MLNRLFSRTSRRQVDSLQIQPARQAGLWKFLERVGVELVRGFTEFPDRHEAHQKDEGHHDAVFNRRRPIIGLQEPLDTVQKRFHGLSLHQPASGSSQGAHEAASSDESCLRKQAPVGCCRTMRCDTRLVRLLLLNIGRN